MKFKARSPLIRPWLAPVILGRLQLVKVAEERRISGSGISSGKGPAPSMRRRPFDGRVEIGFQVDDWTLTTAIRQFRMVSLVEQVKHDRPKTKVEWDVMANFCPRVTLDLQLFEPPPLDLPHSDNLAEHIPTNTRRIRPQPAIDHLRQILQVGDVVNLRILWRGRHRLSF